MEEDKKFEYKIKVPIMNNLELAELQTDIFSHYDRYINAITETITRDKEFIIYREIIKYQDKIISNLWL